MTVGSRIAPGDNYGEWTVLSRTDDRRRVRFICRCSCDREVDVLAQNLVSYRSVQCRSCANHNRAHLKDIPRGLYGRLYHQARDAVRRCTNPEYADYYGRIKVFPSWLINIKLFIEYLITLSGYDNTSLVLDRINNDSDYEPGNLRFVTWSESNYNRRFPSRKEV